jgi:SAM-dependent methyltransferase
VASKVKQVVAVDVSEEISRDVRFPDNFSLLITNGTEIPVPANSVDIVYSNQLMEHLHPDDAAEQLTQVFSALRRGGVYICVTPNRLCGPHDVSGSFDSTPKGLHLREYSNSELVQLFRTVGFRRFRTLLSYRSLILPFLIPTAPVLTYEKIISVLPEKLMRLPAHLLLAVKFIAYKV